jgi:DNA-binding NarL/FixJ family response regulator
MSQVGERNDALRIAIAHRHRLIADALHELVRGFGASVVAVACDRDMLLRALPDIVLDVLLLDAGLDPAGGTIALLEDVRAADTNARVIVLAERLDDALALLAEEGELEGLVLTSEAATDLAVALNQVARRHVVFPAGWLHHAHRAAVSNPLADLTARQREVLHLVGQGLDNDTIAQRLYVSPNTVKAHLRTIYRVLDVHNRVEAARALAGSPVRVSEVRPSGVPKIPRAADAVGRSPA